MVKGDICLVSDPMGKAFSLLPLSVRCIFIDGLYHIEKFPSILISCLFLSKKVVLDFVKCFSVSTG